MLGSLFIEFFIVIELVLDAYCHTVASQTVNLLIALIFNDFVETFGFNFEKVH